MFDPQMELLLTEVEKALEALDANPENETAWSGLAAAIAAAEEEDEDLALAVECRDAGELRTLFAGWLDSSRLLCVHDREVLKRAMKAYRKSLKLTVLDAESSLGGGPMSSGRSSGICGIRPPERYPIQVWNELARQKRLVDEGHGTFSLPPGG